MFIYGNNNNNKCEKTFNLIHINYNKPLSYISFFSSSSFFNSVYQLNIKLNNNIIYQFCILFSYFVHIYE